MFHRVIENFMIQGGGMTADLKEKSTRPPIPLESRNGLNNDRGTIAIGIAATGDGHVAVLQRLAEILLDEDKARELRETTDADDVVRVLTEQETQ